MTGLCASVSSGVVRLLCVQAVGPWQIYVSSRHKNREVGIQRSPAEATACHVLGGYMDPLGK